STKKEVVAAKNGALAKKGVVAAKPVLKESSDDESSDDDSSDESSDEEPNKKKQAVAAKNGKVAAPTKTVEAESSDSSDSDDTESDKPTAAKKVSVAAPPKKVDDSDSSSDSESEDSESEGEKRALDSKKSSNSEEESEEDTDESDEDSEEKPSKTPKKNNTDVEMADAVSPKTKQTDSKSEKKAPQTPVTPQGQTTSKTLFVGNLSFNVEQTDVENFFKDAGEIVDVRFASDADGRFKGFGHVEFATVEAAQKAVSLNGQDLLGRAVKLDFARERGQYTPHDGKESSNSFQKGGRGQACTAYVRGFDKSLGEDEIRSALEEHFGSCGDITRMSIPKDYDSGAVKGFAYVDFDSSDGLNSALGLDGSELNGYGLNVEEARPRGDGAGSGRGGGGRSGGGRSGGRDSGGRFGGRRGGGRGGGGGRFGGGGGRFGGGGRGRGTPYKPSFGSTGKKTKFDDDE
ncbi:nucleolin 2-like, partial [Quercus suber]